MSATCKRGINQKFSQNAEWSQKSFAGREDNEEILSQVCLSSGVPDL